MSKLKTVFPLLQVNSPAKAAAFYTKYFDFKVVFESDWYVQVGHGSQELAFIVTGHESIPPERRQASRYVCLTLEVEDVDLAHDRVGKAMEVVVGPRDEEWGQRHFLGYDPSGVMLDVMALLPNTESSE